tara:strand:- start:8209 stop:8550 length:342 start_codon:yes stop_codon:yes gene_type:complete
MNLKEKFTKYSSMQLIIIAETNSDYTDHAKNIAIDIINDREKKDEINIIKEATKYWKDYLNANFKTLIIEKKIPKSYFLNDHKMKEILKLAFEDWKEKQDLFGIDVTKYWAIF